MDIQISNQRKSYIATLSLGKSTDTHDINGKINCAKPIPALSENKIKLVLKSFIGEILQTPPMYSAKKINGKYECFRRTFDTSMPNGLLFSKDYKYLYVAQSDYRASEKRELRAYPVNDDGSLGKYEILHDFGPHRGIDGMTLSEEGYIVACNGWEISGPGGMINIFDQKGRILETHPTPSLRPTNCTFIDQDLYVTSIEGHLLVAKNTGLKGYLLYPKK